MTARFDGKVVVVTGAGSGIGQGIAKAFAAEKATVIVNDVREDGAKETIKEIEEGGGTAFLSCFDIADREAVEAAFASVVAQFGGVDVLVNNAGIITRGPAEEAMDRFLLSVQVNLVGTFLCSRTVAVQSMLPRGRGAIVNIASPSGLAAVWNDVGYTTTKHGVLGMTKALAVDWARRGVRVNAVLPGFTMTPAAISSRNTPEKVKLRLERVPMARMGEPEDHAAAVMYLASDEAAYVTGIALPVDGGQLALHSGQSLPPIE